ncbi:ABC transporter substrate-binding protein [Jiangella aurantiaca]|uniref:ABC transporter substrate-binding protein n=1 Tax=Jiangella aurantiaca TaxID=2530373 RepID=A0A4R5AHF4_9ACTN|nr:ABC transporter substrate-binding protein [Jiangella aurantiaca]TDD70739.1 ABC transporter substrate-binding protein [Jiangella aurantiaca]
MAIETNETPRDALQSGGLTRRNLLALVGIGGSLIALKGTLSGCSSDTSGQEAAPQLDCQRLAAAMATPFRDLDPTTSPLVSTFAIVDLVYEPLYRVDPFPPRELTPVLATELPREINPTTYRIHLREGTTFHDGSPLTADDVVFTLDRIRNPETNSPYLTSFTVIDAVTAVSDTEIELTLKHPTTLLAERLALIWVLSRNATSNSPDALKLEPIGTGPYRVQSAVSEQSISLESFSDYQGDRRLGFVELEISVVPDDNARVSGLRTGQFSVIENAPANTYETLSNLDGISIEAVPSSLATYLMFHTAQPPFDDPRVRRAVLYAIDRDSITQIAFAGHAEPAWSHMTSPQIAGAVETSTVYSYDVDRASELLAEAGLGGGITIDMLINNDETLTQQAPIIQENLRQVGITANVIPGDIQAQAQRAIDGNYHMWLTSADAGAFAGDAEWGLRWLYGGAFVPRQARWENAGLIEMLDIALAAPDLDTRNQALAEAQHLLQTEAPLIPVHFVDKVTAWDSALDGYQPLPKSGFGLDTVNC